MSHDPSVLTFKWICNFIDIIIYTEALGMRGLLFDFNCHVFHTSTAFKAHIIINLLLLRVDTVFLPVFFLIKK